MSRFRAFVDESGQRAFSPRCSDHFIMSAIVVAEKQLPETIAALATLRERLGRCPGDVLQWKNIKTHTQRLHAAQFLGRASFLTKVSVVICKRRFKYFSQNPPNDEQAELSWRNDDDTYLSTLRLLLERLSWFARSTDSILSYTLAHIQRFRLQTLRAYEAALQEAQTEIDWAALDPTGGTINRPSNIEQLQLADIAASATGVAFNPDQFGNVECRYLHELAPRFYRSSSGGGCPRGLRLYPWNDETRSAYGWIETIPRRDETGEND